MHQQDVQRLDAIIETLHEILDDKKAYLSVQDAHAPDKIKKIEKLVQKLSKRHSNLKQRIQKFSQNTLELNAINASYQQVLAEKIDVREALRTSEEMFKAIALSALDAIIVMDDQGNIAYWNDAARRIFQYKRDEAIGMNLHKLLTQAGTHDQFQHGFAEFAHSGKGRVIGQRLELAAVRKDKQIIPVEISLSSVEIKGKWHAIGTVRDVSDRKVKERLEKQLSQSQQMEAIGRLAAGVAHDLNNVLSGIVSYPELILMDLPSQSPLRRPLATIQRSGKKATAIVQDLLALARRGVSTFEIVDLKLIIQDYLTSPECCKILSEHPKILITENYAQNLMRVKGIPIHLAKAVMNIIGNAIESMPNGGLLEITLQNHRISQCPGNRHKINPGSYVELCIKDTGIGISEKDLDHIFEPFYTKKVMGRSGTGLGMAVVWGAVKDHNGHIEITSKVNEGTQVTVYLPATREPLNNTVTHNPMDELKGNGQTILLVDDVADQREIGSQILTRLGYQVSTVSSGEEAIEYLRHHTVDLLILDMIMIPGIDGCETYRRSLLINPNQKAIITSGFSESGRVKEVQRIGAGAYLRKPYTIEKLGTAVANAICSISP